jgi:hypothetical protein
MKKPLRKALKHCLRGCIALSLTGTFCSTALAQYAPTYGMEASTPSAANWVNQGSSETVTVVNDAANARTGSSYLSFTTTSSSAGKYFYNNYVNVLPGVASYYVYHIVWVKGSAAGLSADATLRYFTPPPPSTGSSGPTASSYTNIETTNWTRVSYGPSSNYTNTTRAYFPAPRISGGGTGKFFYYDDGVVYFQATNKPIDLTKPTAPAFGVCTATNLAWTNGSDGNGSEATGVQATLLLKTTNLSAANPVLNDQAAYEVGQNTAGVTATAGDWQIVSNNLGATDVSYAINTTVDTKYAIVHRDLAYNYSVAAVVTVGTSTPVRFGVVKAVTKGADNISIQWEALQEQHVLQYVVEKSANGKEFHALQTIAAQNMAGARYSINDNQPFAGSNYYRIKALDKDGKTTYSSILRVLPEKAGTHFQVSPNPVKNNTLNLQMAGLEKGEYQLQLFDANGRLLTSKKLLYEGGSVNYTITVETPVKGLVMAKLNRGTVSLTRQLLFQ